MHAFQVRSVHTDAGNTFRARDCVLTLVSLGVSVICIRRVRDLVADSVHRARIYFFTPCRTCGALVDVHKFKDPNLSSNILNLQKIFSSICPPVSWKRVAMVSACGESLICLVKSKLHPLGEG